MTEPENRGGGAALLAKVASAIPVLVFMLPGWILVAIVIVGALATRVILAAQVAGSTS